MSLLKAAVLRDISVGTSYQTVRLVFRPYIHLSPSSWTSEQLRSSIRIYPDFNPNRYSSLSFGSHSHNYSISLGSDLIISSPRCARELLGPCYNTGLTSQLTLLYFHSFTLYWDFFIFPSQYFFSIGLSSYLALDVTTTYSHCTTKQSYSLSCLYHGAITLFGSPFHGISIKDFYNTSRFTIRALSCSVAPTKEIHVCFFSCSYWYA